MSLESNNLKQEKLILLPEYYSKNPNTHEQIICDFAIKETLGKGAFGVVKLAINSQTGEKVAIKIINETKIAKEQKLNFLREIEILKNIKHPNIIRLYSHISKQKQLYLITEYIKGIELFQYISLKKKIEESEACIYFQQIICGLEYLHKMGISHRDIKCENILVDHHLKEIKIIDFGLSNKYSDKSELLSTLCGSPLYAAPEVLTGKGYKPRPVDIWSAGIVLYFMLSGRLPFQADTDEELYKKIIDAKITNIKGISKEGNDLVKQILNPNPRKRISIFKIKSHPWFNLFNNNNFVNINYYGLSVNKYVIPIDEEIVEEIKNQFNISDVEIRASILENKLNDITTLYYLIVIKKEKEGKKSISDFKNEDFKKYIKDENNSLKKYGNDINKVIKMRKNGVEAEKLLELERSDSKGVKRDLILVKVNSEAKKEFYRSLSPTVKTTKYEVLFNKNDIKLRSPKLVKSERSEILDSNSNKKYVRNDTDTERTKANDIGKYKKLFIKTDTPKMSFVTSNSNINSPIYQKRKINKNVSNNKYNRYDSDNKFINSRIKNSTNITNITSRIKNSTNITNITNNLSSDKKMTDEEKLNKKNKSDNKNKKNEKPNKTISNKKDINVVKNNNKDNAKNSTNKKNNKNINSSDKKNNLIINEDKIIKDEIKEKEIQIKLANMLPATEATNASPLESPKECGDKSKKEITIKKISGLTLNMNNQQKSQTLPEQHTTTLHTNKNITENYTPKIEEKIIIFKKQNTGLLYKKRKVSKTKNIINKKSIRQCKIEDMKMSSINNKTNYDNNKNKNLTLNSFERPKNKNKNCSIKNYLKTEKNNNEEDLNNQKEIHRYFSSDLLNIKNSNKNNNDIAFIKKNYNKIKNNNNLLSNSNRHIKSTKKYKSSLVTSLSSSNNIKELINTNIQHLNSKNNINDINDNNTFIEPFDLNNIYYKKKGEIKKVLIEKLEKKKIKYIKNGNYNFIVELKKETTFDFEIKGNKDIYDNISILKIKNGKRNKKNNNIYNYLKKIL